jgi:NAD(P)-dependent dehydrogenase (short-subunit alcohol dehydrogenase family)
MSLLAQLSGEDAKRQKEKVKAENATLAFEMEKAKMSPKQRAELDAAMAQMTEQERQNLRERMVYGTVINKQGAIMEAMTPTMKENGEAYANQLKNNALTVESVAGQQSKNAKKLNDEVMKNGKGIALAADAGKGGSIILTASVAGMRSGAGGPPYSASKAGVINLAQVSAQQLSGTNVRCNAICPGLTETGMTKPTFDYAREKGVTEKIGRLNPLRRGARIDARMKQGLVGVYVADAGNHMAVHDHQLDRCAAAACFPIQHSAIEIRSQRFGADGGKQRMNECIRTSLPQHQSETSRIAQPDHATVVDDQIKVIMFLRRCRGVDQPQPPRHAQMHDQRTRFVVDR